MSRSYKRYPGYSDSNPFMKNYANRRIRRLPVDVDIADGCSYRKLNCSYDICDWRFFEYVDSAKGYLVAKRKKRFTLLFGWRRLCDVSDDHLIKQYWREVSK